MRDQIVDYITYWKDRAEVPAKQLLGWLELGPSTFHSWKDRYGKANEHNGQIPRDHWLEDWEKAAIVDYHDRHPLEGYRRLTFMMLDDDVVACSPATVYRVLKAHGRLDRRAFSPSKKGTGFVQPLKPHEHWHIDVSYINLEGTFYYLTSVLDGCSRAILHWELRESMTEQDVEVILQKALETYPGRIATDHLRQWPAVHRAGLQGIHPSRRSHSRADESLLSPVQRQDRTLARQPQIASASGRLAPPAWKKLGGGSKAMSSTTTRCGCTRRSATSRP